MLKGIELEGTGLPILELRKVTGVKYKITEGMGRIYLEEMGPGQWRLTYSEHLIPDIKKLTALRLVREPEEKPTIEELAARVDPEAAEYAIASLWEAIQSLESTSTENLPRRMAEIAKYMNDLSDAVGGMEEARDPENGT